MTAVVSLSSQEKTDLCPLLAAGFNTVQNALSTLETQLDGSDFNAFTLLKHNEAVVSWAACDQWAALLDALGLSMVDVFPSSNNSSSPKKPPRPT